PDRAVNILAQVAAALDAAHDAGLVHRDVKPSNVLLARPPGIDAAEHAWLADFGLALHTATPSQLTRSGGLVGTVDYVAPEQITGVEAARRADVYGLGCVLCECLTGQVPYPRASQLAALWAHVNDPPPALSERQPDLPPAADAVVARALAKSPDDRYATCGELAAAARSALVGGGHPPRLRRPRRSTARLPGAAAAAAVLATALVLTLGASGSHGLARLPPNSLGRLDPGTGHIEQAIPVGQTPTRVALGRNAVWVANQGDPSLWDVDPTSGHRRAAVPLDNAPTDLAVGGDGVVYVAQGFGQEVDRIDPRTLAQKKRHFDGGPQALAFGAGAVWVVDETNAELLRLAPSNLAVTGRVPLG